ncbi:glycoside hydrolase family 97 protein [Phocaeicola dorei]|nr:glycoside hydrolase family 97 protein [Phocaeicola dorei]
MKNNKKLCLAILSLLLLIGNASLAAKEKKYVLSSPDGTLKVEISAGNELVYQVMHGNDTILSHSNIALVLEDGTIVGRTPRITGERRKKIKDNIESPFYRFKEFVATGNELDLKLKGGFGIIFRAYNEGVAYRFYTTQSSDIIIKEEQAEFNFKEDYTAYLPYTTNDKQPMAMAFQNVYDITPLSKAQPKLAFLPVTVDCGSVKLTLLESDLEAYPGMFVQSQQGKYGLKGVFAPYPAKTDFYPWRKQEYVTETTDFISRSRGSRSYPWRVLAITEKDTDMPVNNLVYALASPNRIGDTSWIKTGKVAWDWWNDWNLKGVPFKAGINMDTYKYYIDFASRNGLEFIVLDEGWYDPKSGDMLTVIPELDLPELIVYGKSKGVEIVLWTVFNVLDSQLEAACKKYADMGIKGFKVDFLDRDDQTAVEMVYRIAEMTARYKLTLDLHGIYKPTGINRTYPHIINFESVFGMEEVKWTDIKNNMPLYDVTFPYIRMMAGTGGLYAGSYAQCYEGGLARHVLHTGQHGTRCHQLAAYIVHDSPFTMLCDAPTNYLNEQECVDFIASLPVEVDSTFIASGELGKYIVTVRKKDVNWYIGGMTNWDERDVQLDFSFLPEGVSYTAVLFKDGVNANKQAEDYRKETICINKDSRLTLHLASGGGFAMKLELCPVHGQVTGIPEGKNIPSFYQKYIETEGLYVTSSGKVSDEALLKACDIISLMLAKRPDVKAHMVKKGCHVMIIGKDEETCDLPEFAHICNCEDSIKYWNWRARGFGGKHRRMNFHPVAEKRICWHCRRINM